MTQSVKIENLSYVVEHALFAPSVTAFGQLFSEKGRNLGRRIVNRELKNYDAVYENFQESFGLTDEDINDLVGADKMACLLYQGFKKRCSNVCSAEEREQERFALLDVLLNEELDALPQEILPCSQMLEDLLYNNWFSYIHCIAFFFLKSGGYRIYHKHFLKDYDKIFSDMLLFFSEKFTHRMDLLRMVRNYKDNPVYISQVHYSVWGLVQLLEVILGFANSPSQLESYLNQMKLFDWEEDTYWVTPEHLASGNENEIWWMWSLEGGKSGSGYYFFTQLQTDEVKGIYHLVDFFTLSFFGGQEDNRVQLSNPRVPGSVIFGVGEWDKDSRILTLDFDENVSVPTTLYQLDKRGSNEVQSLQWVRTIERFEREQYQQIFKEMHELNLNQELLDEDYQVQDVIISRTQMDLVIRDLKCADVPADEEMSMEQISHLPNDTLHRYRIHLDDYDFLRHILPSDEVDISRHNSDGRLYVNWFVSDYMIPLDAFEEIPLHIDDCITEV